MKYQIRLINLDTNESVRTNWIFTNRKKADAFVLEWKKLGRPYDAEVIVIK